MQGAKSGVLLVFVGAVVAACASHAPTPPEKLGKARAALVASIPEPPSISRPVHLVESELSGGPSTFARPTLPALRTSVDGRIGVDLKKRNGRVYFYLVKPESLTAPFAATTPGTPAAQSVVLDSLGREGFDASLFYDAMSGTVKRAHDHTTLCGGAPRSCGVGSNDDCYDITVISSISWEETVGSDTVKKARLVGQPITVQVTNPKTASASVVSLTTTGARTEGPAFVANSFFEPMVTADGRLMVGRLNSANVLLDGFETPTNIVYSVYPATEAPCDVTKWGVLGSSDWHRISWAYVDPNMTGRYGIADAQLRDPEGNLITAGHEIHASYPWIDREGSNLFFTWIAPTHYYTDASNVLHERYPSRCIDHDVPPTKSVSLDPMGFTGAFTSIDDTAANLAGTPPNASYTNQIPSTGDPICSEHMSVARDTCMPTGFSNRVAAAETAPNEAYLYSHLLWRICKASPEVYACPTGAYAAPAAERTVAPLDTMTVPGSPTPDTVCRPGDTALPCANHHLYLPPTGVAPRAALFVLLPGSGMEPDKHDLVLRTAAFAGYKTIGLSYNNSTSMNDDCKGADITCPGRCFADVRNEKIFGKDCATQVIIKPSDSIAERLYRLLRKLHHENSGAGWDAYFVNTPTTTTSCGAITLNDTGSACTPGATDAFNLIAWEKIVVAGFSQGGGHAVKISRMREVNGVLALDTDADVCETAGVPSAAQWITSTADASSCKPHVLMSHGHRCVTPSSGANIASGQDGAADLIEYDDVTRGVAVVGRWTKQKIVVLDGMLNNVDNGLRRLRKFQREIQLYTALGANDGWVRVGTGRDNTGTGVPAGMTENSTIIDSFENLFHHESRIRPETVRDVVWFVNMGKVTDEVVFDDFLDANVIIHSDMVPSTTVVSRSSGNDRRTYNDGFVHQLGFTATPRLQNAATTTAWTPPSYGAVDGLARTEPVALGGIRGRGLWLDGIDDGVRYAWGAQPQSVTGRTVYAGLFVDPRFPDDGQTRLVFSLPNGVRVFLVGRHAVTIFYSGALTTTVALPVVLPAERFSHIAIEAGPQDIRLFLDGFLLGAMGWGLNSHLQAGDFVLGFDSAQPYPPFRGWVDELRVLVGARGPEIYCNHARGTLIGLTASAPASWIATANLYPANSHSDISAILAANGQPVYNRYACLVDYTSDRMPAVPPGAVGIRAGILALPVLVWNTPRPNTAGNAFCTSCHQSGNPTSLSLSALAATGVPLYQDPRRQPTQPPQRITGVVPVGYVRDTGLPLAFQASGNHPLDRWVYP